MNETQRGLTWFFAASIVASIVFAPWEQLIIVTEVGQTTVKEIQSAIWEPPKKQAADVGMVRLRTEVLIREWIAASMIYAAGYFALGSKKQIAAETQQEPVEK